MALWNENKEDLAVKTGTVEAIKENGVYELEINEAYISNSTSSSAVGLTIDFQGENNRMRTTFWYKKGDGSPNQYAERHLNRMLFLCKTKMSDLKLETKEVKGFDGKEFKRTFVSNLAGKKIGVITEVTAEKNGEHTRYNYNVRDFYDVKTGKTADEITNKTEAKTVEYFKNRYSKEKVEVPARPQTNTDNGEDDEFPF